MKTISLMIDLYLHGDKPNAWRGKYAEHPTNEAGHSEGANYEFALKHLRDTEIDLPAGDERATKSGLLGAKRCLRDLKPEQFRPSDLRAVQNRMIGLQRSRNYVNRTIRRIVDFFSWMVSYEYTDAGVLTALKCVAPIAHGKPGVRETDPILSVPQAALDATSQCAPWIVRQAMRLQEIGNMRPGELVRMKICDLRVTQDSRGEVGWEYRPRKHKNAHRRQSRNIYFGADGQTVLRDVISAVFGQGTLGDGEFKMPRLGDTADDRRIWPWKSTQTYGAAVRKARKAASVARWTPNQLRKKRTTYTAAKADVETAAQSAGHADDRTTKKAYIDPSTEKAKQFQLDFG